MDEPTCPVPDPEGHSKSGGLRNGMCNKHYQRAWLYGDPLVKRSRWDDQTPEMRFLAKVDKDGPLPEKRPELGPCWAWTGAKQGSGYGHFRLEGRGIGAHVAAYALMRGSIPEGTELDHLCHPGDGSCPRVTCRHRLCVNPDHLEPVTRLENQKRGNTWVAAQMAKTHCPKGHEYTPENTRVRIAPSGNPMRSCKKCQKEANPRTGEINLLIAANAAKTHCPKGHEYTPENTIIDPSVGGKNGGRRCKICRREQAKARYDARKVASVLRPVT